MPLSWLFRLLVGCRRAAYRAGLLRSRRCGVPVIVVGNLTTGGTGKTPLVEWIVRRLQAENLRPGIISRGYGRKHGNGDPEIVKHSHRAEDVGDEPLLLARRTGVPVCVGADRVSAADRLLESAAVDVIVADDGLQHYRLQRDLEIIVIDGQRGIGNGRLLPAGPLREPRSRLDAADLVLSNGVASQTTSLAFELVPGKAVALMDGRVRALDEFRHEPVLALAGIGNPERFYRLLEEHGIRFEPVPVADHGVVELAALSGDGARAILMTEKDAVKYPAADVADAWQVPVEVRMSAEALTAVEERLLTLAGHASNRSVTEDK